MASKKVTLSADGTTATVADATLSDVFTTLLSSDSAITGTYKYLQTAVVGVGGAMVQNVRNGRGLNIFKSANSL